jgi:hypothetical protein
MCFLLHSSQLYELFITSNFELLQLMLLHFLCACAGNILQQLLQAALHWQLLQPAATAALQKTTLQQLLP